MSTAGQPSEIASFVQSSLERYQRLQRYVGWTDKDAENISRAQPIVSPHFDTMISDFYGAIQSEPETAAIIRTPEQLDRLRTTLRQWLVDFYSGRYDEEYVRRRWRVGWRHVEIGLEQSYVIAAFARLRRYTNEVLDHEASRAGVSLTPIIRSVNLLLDLEMALIEEAYSKEHVLRQKLKERIRGETVFRKLVESSGCMIVILREDESIGYFSTFAEELTGYPAVDANGKNYIELLLPPGDKHRVRDELGRLFSKGEPQRGFENPIVCRDGAVRWLVWNAQRLDEFEGQPAVLAVGHDITQRKDAEERALQSERLAAIGQMITGLAHESRNAFQRSQACLELLALELEGKTDLLELVARIQRALDHLHHLYEEVRDYAAPVKLDRQQCDLRHVWRDSWTHLDVMRGSKQVALREENADEELTCNCDWFAMGQVFRNIFENAISASPDPGRIVIRARTTRAQGVSLLRISVLDNGPGLAMDVKNRVFEPFFTTKTKGTGLGMAIAKRIVEAHGGSITVGESTSGAEFIIQIPRGLP